ncbi:MAG: hypothetical protein JRF07_04855 [Deltaproteobacteria bacterium]|nr:hypothetical protein [Deltaproteobacteria bacterium]
MRIFRRHIKTVAHKKKEVGMLRSFIVKASLALGLLTPVLIPAAIAEEAPDISNIGFVLYTKSYAPGTLNARWMYTDKYSGPGIATGGPIEGFAGNYHVRYFYDNGEFSDEYDLVIEKTGYTYKLMWLTDGEVSAIGVGMEVENGLAVGWRRVAD